MAVERAFVRPQRVQIVQAQLPKRPKGNFQTSQSMKRGGRGKQVRRRRLRRSQETALIVKPRQKPASRSIVYRNPPIPQDRHRGRGSRRRACPNTPLIRPTAVAYFQMLERLRQTQRVGNASPQVLPSAISEKISISSADRRTRTGMKPSVLRSKRIQTQSQPLRLPFLKTRKRKAPNQTAQMHKIQPLPRAKSRQPRAYPRLVQLHSQRQRSVDPKNRIVKIAAACPVAETAVGILLPPQKTLHQLHRPAQHARRQPSHLQHLKTKTHKNYRPPNNKSN